MTLVSEARTVSSKVEVDAMQASAPSVAAANDDFSCPSSAFAVRARHSFGGHINNALKRWMDILISGSLLLALTPLLILVALLICLDGGTPFFRHARVGKHLRSFDCLKFRSMMPGAEDMLEEYLAYNTDDAILWNRERKLSFDPRITAIGRILRRTSMDELPQLFNVLRGDMSLVGPRPVTRAEVAYYGAFIGCYASVKPGMTGLWQVSGRSEISYDARVVLDCCYANVHSVVMDLAILLRTPAAVFSRRGAR